MIAASIRNEFPGVRGRAFLDAACVSLAPRCAADALASFARIAVHHPARSATDHHIAMDSARAGARPTIAKMLNARADEIALVESTSHGLSILATALPLEPGDRVLLSDLEFMQVALPFLQLRESRGIEIDVVPSRDGVLRLEDLADRVGPRTRVVAISSVMWTTGQRMDLEALGAICRARGAWLVVDAIQQLGAVPIDVEKTPVDAIACGGHKWLNSPFGCGFLYVSRARMSELRRTLGGYLSLEPPEEGWGGYFASPRTTPMREGRFVREARALETGGTSNYPGALGLQASIEQILRVGQDAIAAHVRALGDRVVAGVDALGVRIVSPTRSSDRAGIVTFTTGDPDDDVRLVEHLLGRQVLVSARYMSGVGGVRVSCHLYDVEADVDQLIAETRVHIGRRSAVIARRA